MDAQSFYDQVYAVVRLIPKGMVMSYGGVARQAGYPGRARGVGYALHALSEGKKVPWWRVINSAGRISIPDPDGAQMQRAKLMAEGVAVDDDLRVNMRDFDAEMRVYEKLHRALSKS